MKILYITSEIPNLASGFLRHYHFLRRLGERHEITHLSLTRKTTIGPELLAPLEPYARRRMIFGPPNGNESWLVSAIGQVPVVGTTLRRALWMRHACSDMKHAVDDLLQHEQFDLVLFSGKDTFGAIETLSGVPLVADCCDATSLRLRGEMRHASTSRRLKLLLRYAQIRRIEKKLVRKTPYLAFASCRDRKALLGRNVGGEVIPNGVNLAYWRRKVAPGTDCLVFTGVMSYPPNADAARYLIAELLPLIRQSIPGIKTLIVGRDPAPDLIELAKHEPNITLTGYVDDVRPYLERATVFVAPVRYASGVQNKILEALAMGVPVVTTSVVVAGVKVQGAGRVPVVEADTTNQFVKRTVALLRDQEERRRLALEGRRYVERHFDFGRSAAKLETMCLVAVAENRRCQQQSPVVGQPCSQLH
jgi:glycosyltransferase involved in cell wall biosynthesis